jgi:alkylhydroperoxidase family enzyme
MAPLPALPFPPTDTLPDALAQEVRARRSLNVYRMVMHTPEVAPAFLALSDALRHRSSLPGTWRELAILRVGHAYDAPYEVHHHERLARAAGLSEAAIEAAHVGGQAEQLDPRERLVLALTDDLLANHALGAASRDRALAAMSTTQLADLVLTVGFYQQVCNFLNTFGVPIED